MDNVNTFNRTQDAAAMREFFAAVLPAPAPGVGLMSVIAYPKQDSDTGVGYSHRVHPDIDTLVARTLSKDGKAGYPCYFALASFPFGENGPNSWAPRKASQAVAVRSVWLDIDCLSPAKQLQVSRENFDAATAKKYYSKVDAVGALTAFLTKYRLPLPMVIDSGNGLHCYWTFSDAAVPVDETWRITARRIAALAKKAGFIVDPSRVADAASVLRPVGSTHLKADSTEARKVAVLNAGAGPMLFSNFVQRVEQLAKDHEVTLYGSNAKTRVVMAPEVQALLNRMPQEARRTFMVAQTGSLDGHERNASYSAIAATCRQMTGFGDQPYDVRLLAASVVSHCRGGRDVYIKESLQCPTLRANGSVTDDADIIAKATDSYDRWQAEGLTPAYCAAFGTSAAGDKCAGCEYAGRSDFTPVSLGMGRAQRVEQAREAQLEAPVDVVHNAAGDSFVALPVPPGFRERNGGLEYVRASDDGEEQWFPLLKNGSLRLVHVLEETGRTGPTSKYVYHRVMTSDKSRKGDFVEFTPRQIGRKQEMLDRMLDMQLVPEHDGQMHAYMRATLTQQAVDLPVHTVISHFGWLTSEDMNEHVGPNSPVRTASPEAYDDEMSTRFILNRQCFYPGGSSRVFYTPQAESTARSRGVGAEGTFTRWKTAADVLIRNEQTAGLYCLALSFGAALMQFAPAGTSNPIVNFWAPSSGTGKSTVLRIANSVWAHPDRAMAQADDSAAARSLYMPDFYSLPISVDEITNVKDEELSQFVFMAARGVERATATRDRNSREARRWCSVILSTANNTVAQKIAEFSKDRPGEQMRAIDILLTYPNSVRGRVADNADLSVIGHNYGTAGAEFVKCLLADTGRMRAAVRRLAQLASNGTENYQPRDGERFWATAQAIAVLAAELVTEFGILPLDAAAIERFGAEAIEAQRSLQKEVCGVDGQSVVDAFYAEHVGQAILRVVGATPTHACPASETEEGKYVMEPKPTRAIVGRYEVAESRFVVLASAFDDFCKRSGHHPNIVLEDVAGTGGLDERHTRKKAGGYQKVRYPLLNGSHLGQKEYESDRPRSKRMQCYIFKTAKS